MKISKICFQNYKGFFSEVDSSPLQEFEIAPLTVVFGKNNSGKSALVRLAKLMLGALECDDTRRLPLEVRGLSFGSSFLDLVPGGDFFGRPEFHLRAHKEDEVLDVLFSLFSRSAFSADEPPNIWSYRMLSPEKITISEPTQRESPVVEITGILPDDPRWKAWRSSASAALNSMVHLGPVRAQVKPVYNFESFNQFDGAGESVPQLLRRYDELANAVGKWFTSHLDGWGLAIRRQGDGFSIRVAKSATNTTNLSQAGEGLQQVLPVVAHQFWRQQNPVDFIDIVEQPELHLHPAAQAPLADLYIDTLGVCSGQTIVETNSEGFLLRLQRRVAEGLVSASKIALYYVATDERGGKVHRISIDSDGELSWWPSGVFEEDFDEISAIRRAQRSARK